MINRLFSLLILAAAALYGVPAGAENARFSLQQALEYAYTHNPTLRAARSELQAVQEQLPQALSNYKPTITAEGALSSTEIAGSNFGAGGGGEGATSKDLVVSLSQPIFRGFRTISETAAAESTIRAQEELLRITEQSILLDSVTAYMDVLRDEALLRLSTNNRAVLARESEATQDRFEVGELTLTDVSQAKARLSRAESDVISAQGVLHASRAVFEQVIGQPPEGLFQPELELTLPENLDDAVLKAETQSPAVLSAQYAHKASEEDVDGIFGELLPEIGFVASWNRTFDPQPGLIEQQTTESVGLSATIPLYDAGSVRSRVRQAKHTANQRYLEILEAKRNAREEAVRAWENLQARQAEIRSRKAQVEASKIAREGVSQEQYLGTRTVLDLLDADQELLDAQVNLVTTERNQRVAQFALLSSVGELSADMLKFAQTPLDPRGNVRHIKWKFFDMNVDRLGEDEEAALTSP